MRTASAGVLAGCVLACLLLPAAAPVQAEIVIYRCTDASGALTMQNGEPCPAGSKQERMVIEPAPTMPVYVPPPAAPAPLPRIDAAPAAAAPAAPERPQAPAPAALADADRLPPPPIFRCNTWDNDSYLSEDSAPKPRCVRIATTGIGGLQGLGAGAACEMRHDQCERVPDGAACEGWRQRQREVESAWRHARGDDRGPLQEEFARISRILTDTTCGG